MKISRIFFLFTLVLFGCTLTKDAEKKQMDASLSQFIIGRWQSTSWIAAEAGSGVVEYQLEFVDTEKLIYSEKSNQSNVYNIVFQYRFIDEHRIRIEGRLVTEWDLIKSNENLIITASDSFGPEGVFERVSTINWPLIASFLIIVVIGYAVTVRHSTAKGLGIKVSRQPTASAFRKRKPFSHYWSKISMIAILGLGMFLGKFVSIWWSTLLIRLPWDAIILLEVCTLTLIFSIRMISMNKILTESLTLINGWKYRMGWLLAGISIGGILVNLLKLALFIYFGSYGFGA